MTELSLAVDRSDLAARQGFDVQIVRRRGFEPTEIGDTFSEAASVISGIVERGQQLARKLGFPTANVAVPEGARPPFGVYAVRSRLADGREFGGVASLGCNPTVPRTTPVLEVWLFEFDEDIYDQFLITELVRFLRVEQKFDTLEDLRVQVMRDAAAAKCMLRDTPTSTRSMHL